MRLVLVSYFDVGESYGLDDRAFAVERLGPGYDISEVGVKNPLGRGVVVDLLHEQAGLMASWRDAAIAQVDRPDMELRYDGDARSSDEEFGAAIKKLIRHHDVSALEITVYAVGTALLEIEFAPGVSLPFLRGLGRCFEYAAYTPAISDVLLRAARAKAIGALAEPRKNRLMVLTGRSGPGETTDDNAYTESQLLTTAGFTYVVLMVDPGDGDQLEAVLRVLDVSTNAPSVEYEYHGTLHFTWAACVLRARGLAEWAGQAAPGVDEPRVQVGRMLADIEIAHSFLGACEALSSLFRGEMSAQVGGYATGRTSGRDPQELNRLRSLALAVVSLTDVDLVTPTEEDRTYFRLFNGEAKLAERQQFIQNACEILYNVQEAEFQGEQARRDRVLGYILAGLTTFTVISVAADAYNFVRENEPLIEERVQRLQLLAEFLLVLGLVVGLFAYLFMRGPRRR
jgi:hypothetical protein